MLILAIMTFSSIPVQSSSSGHRRTNDPFLEALLTRFALHKINRSGADDAIHFSISKMVELGDSLFIFFSVENTGEEPFIIMDIEFEIMTRGYLTGLPVKKTKVYGVIFNLRKMNISSREKTDGVVSIRQLGLSDTQEVTIRLVGEGEKQHKVEISGVRI